MLPFLVMSLVRNKRGKKIKLDFIDVRRASFHALARRKVFVKLPEEDEEGMCGKLRIKW